MKRTIRLSESDLHNMVRTAINEVLDNMDDTEKAYWLMRQRQERPNTKAKTPVNYEEQFADKFNRTMPSSNCYWDDINHGYSSYLPGQSLTGQTVYGVNPASGEFHSESYGKDYPAVAQHIGNDYELGGIRRGPNEKTQQYKGQSKEADRYASYGANAQANRYRAMRDKYNKRYPNQQG